MYISIHALLAESDPLAKVRHCEGYIFLSTLSLRRATCGRSRLVLCQSHFYPRSPCGERRLTDDVSTGGKIISIHALLAESDHPLREKPDRPHPDFYPRSPCGERRSKKMKLNRTTSISIHALLAESDLGNAVAGSRTLRFLSTLSLRRATIQLEFNSLESKHFYPRSPCGERQPALYQLYDTYAISIHALLAESDVKLLLLLMRAPSFLSTLSLRRATAKVHKTVGHFCAYETNFMEIASSC